mmetsp:Transcript_31776/g.53595  ORF Transcript_31776/g.53595 Transcript_31776/m.53595 type:complete len:401 (+) Transcript_31776:213-1415(+)|eukprot:CAMPEP_0175025066 /NCGR_PEP_ID=MMETSP0005-20121125/16870_1 /TAXON_ID=420556 /ORGANISM="Ochromonas sp., Strain CCMP1393" /LENGTH=400 /DNA_ID=CAMNT_0016283797 /DNA_START=165 /DNA_END=1367 /DNA_ORIENTATION=+
MSSDFKAEETGNRNANTSAVDGMTRSKSDAEFESEFAHSPNEAIRYQVNTVAQVAAVKHRGISMDEPPSIENLAIGTTKPLAGSTFPRASGTCSTGSGSGTSSPSPPPSSSSSSVASDPPRHTFSDCDASSFFLRVGPNYSKTGAKAPAGPSLYEVVGVDFVRCDTRIDDYASKVQLPPEWTAVDTHHPLIPPLFVVNAQLPEDFSFSFFNSKDDGLGWSLAIFFRIRRETAEAIRDLASAPPAVQLFARFVTEAPECFARSSNTAGAKESASSSSHKNPWVGRFKICLRCEQIEKFGLPSFITSYNSKPVLIRNTGTLLRDAVPHRNHYVEMDINIHRFASVPKRALEVMFHRFDQMVISMGFCIESREDAEMPEALFGAVQVNFPSHKTAAQWTPDAS